TLASIYMKMTSEEVWCATTLHAAQAIARPGKIGTLANGALADIVIWNIPNYQYLPYHFGVSLVNCVVKRGKIVWQKN
ncbi:MAG: amidohydrolase family protein, partial [bacterium]|nr:amidohydrolase family protein [bacterium]